MLSTLLARQYSPGTSRVHFRGDKAFKRGTPTAGHRCYPMFSYEKVTLGGGTTLFLSSRCAQYLCQMFVEVRTPDKSNSLCTTSGVSVCINDACCLRHEWQVIHLSVLSDPPPSSFFMTHHFVVSLQRPLTLRRVGTMESRRVCDRRSGRGAGGGFWALSVFKPASSASRTYRTAEVR